MAAIGIAAGTVRFSSSTTEGRRAALGREVPCREDEVEEERGSRAEANVDADVLLLLGIPDKDESVASDSSLRRVESVFSPSCSPESRLTEPNSDVGSFSYAEGARDPVSDAASGFEVSPGPPNELLLLHALFVATVALEGELLRLDRGFGLEPAVPILPSRGILVGVRDFGGGVPDGEGP